MCRFSRLATIIRARFVRTSRCYRKEQSGVAATEFALVAAPFLALTFAVLEVAMFFFGTLMLEYAVDESSRLIRTGQAQQAGSFNETQFKADICSRVVILHNCESTLKVFVNSYNSFEDVDTADQFDVNSLSDDDLTFNIGGEEDIVLVRVFYEWGLLSLLPDFGLGFSTSNLSNGLNMVSAATTFRNEPFGD